MRMHGPAVQSAIDILSGHASAADRCPLSMTVDVYALLSPELSKPFFGALLRQEVFRDSPFRPARHQMQCAHHRSYEISSRCHQYQARSHLASMPRHEKQDTYISIYRERSFMIAAMAEIKLRDTFKGIMAIQGDVRTRGESSA
jgi:hypothetical protein